MVVPSSTERTGWADDGLRILLVDRRPLFLAALAELLKSAWPQASIETLTMSDRAIALASLEPVDLLFCEARAVPLAGPEIAARIHGSGLKTKVVLLGDTEDQHLLVEALACGAAGFFTKDASPEEFLDGVGAVLSGHYVLGSNLLQLSLARLGGRGQAAPGDQLGLLSKVERSILLMLGQAQSTRAIAASRGISQKTVRNHLANIYRKLAVRNRSEAILWSARAGLTEPIAERQGS